MHFVVSQTAVAGAGDPSSPLVERARLEDGFIYELRWTPASEAALSDVNVPPPPPPGRGAVSRGRSRHLRRALGRRPAERSGRARHPRVLDGEPGGDRWEFEATAETANWVSSFFQARDRFTTHGGSAAPADRTLARDPRGPTRARSHLRLRSRGSCRPRGSDARGGATRGRPGARLSAATPPATPRRRSITSARWPCRLAPSSACPSTKAAAISCSRSPSPSPRRIELGGVTHRAIRLEPRLMRRIERRRPIRMTVWLSDDDRKVPLRVLVDAGFGRVRADLVDYRR